MHYLDNAATTPVLREAADAAYRVMCEEFGNPSSQHKMGNRAAALLKQSRTQVLRALGAKNGTLTFTSGGTEAINTAVFGVCAKNFRKGRHIVTTAVEHAATLSSAKELESRGFSVTYIQPDAGGRIPAQRVLDALREDTILVTMMLVNNETGTVLPVSEVGPQIKKRSPHALFHVDAVQGFLRLPLLPEKWGCDFISVSGHKIGAPKGIGALYTAKGVKIPPLLFGGGQEEGRRSGTEAMPGVTAFAAACETRLSSIDTDYAAIARLSAYFKQALADKLPFAQQNGENDIPHVLNYSFAGCKSEVMLRLLESEGVYVSAGSACARGHESHVLKALGLANKQIDTALRISLAPFNTKEDIDALVRALESAAARLRR